MYGASVRILKSREEAEDVVQDCFIKAFEKIHQLQDDANLGGWLKRIVVNKSLDIARANQKLMISDDLSIIENEAEPVKDEVEPSISPQHVKSCIERLKEKYRVVLNLYLIEDYNHREIGELLDLKESTVRNQFRRGKQQLLKLIKN